MALSRIIGILWVLVVSVFLRHWVSTSSVATTWAIILLGIAYAVVCVLEYLGVITWGLATRRRRGPTEPTV